MHQCPCYPLNWKLRRFSAREQLPLLFLIQLYRLGKSVFWRLMGAQAGSPTPQFCSYGRDLGIATRIFLGSLLGKQELGSHPALLSRDLGLGGFQDFLSEALLRKQPLGPLTPLLPQCGLVSLSLADLLLPEFGKNTSCFFFCLCLCVCVCPRLSPQRTQSSSDKAQDFFSLVFILAAHMKFYIQFHNRLTFTLN